MNTSTAPRKKALPVSVERQAWDREREALQRKVTAALDASKDRLWRWAPVAAVAGAVVGFALGRLA